MYDAGAYLHPMYAIKVWFVKGCHYDTGIRLYKAFGKDEALKTALKGPRSAFLEKSLKDSLRALLPGDSAQGQQKVQLQKEPEETPVIASQVETVNTEPVSSGWSKNMSAKERELYIKWKPLFNEMNSLCSRSGPLALAARKDPSLRDQSTKSALRILELEELCEKLYQQRDHLLSTGSLPQEYPYGDPTMDPNQYSRQYENNMKYARDCRRKLEKDPSNNSLKDKLTKYEWFINYYKKKMNLDAV